MPSKHTAAKSPSDKAESGSLLVAIVQQLHHVTVVNPPRLLWDDYQLGFNISLYGTTVVAVRCHADHVGIGGVGGHYVRIEYNNPRMLDIYRLQIARLLSFPASFAYNDSQRLERITTDWILMCDQFAAGVLSESDFIE